MVNNSLGNYTISGSGTIGGTGSLTKSGSGVLTLSTANAYTGGTTVTAGRLLIEPTSVTTSALPTGALSISGNGTVQVADNVTAGTALGTSNVVITSLSLTGNGTLDIGNNRIIIDYTNAATDPIASIETWIKNGFYGLSGPSIISSDIAAADAASGHNYGIGYADGADGVVAGLPSGEIEIMFTLLGDANLDGTVNSEDFTAYSHNVGLNGMWDDGDFNYDGTVNAEDFTPFSINLGQSASEAAAAGGLISINGLRADVPEPTAAGLIMLGSVGAIVRRRRRPWVSTTRQPFVPPDTHGGPEPLARRIISGVTGNIKVALRVGIADVGTIEARRSACFSCKACVPLVASLHKCTDCGCIVEPKTQLSSEKCPRGKWDSVPLGLPAGPLGRD